MEIIEDFPKWHENYRRWSQWPDAMPSRDEMRHDYPVVVNKRAPFVPARSALSMLNLALITSAGAYIDGTEGFDLDAPRGDASFREIPIEIEAEDLRWAARGYDPKAVLEDMNAQVPLARLAEFEGNGIIGQLCPVFWSFCGFIPSARRLVEDSLPQLVDRVVRYEAQAALLIPASRLCHQSMALAARAIEIAGIPTMMIVIERETAERVRPPRAAYYAGEFGSVAGHPNWPEHQRRVLDEALRLLEPMDQSGIRKLTVDLETTIEIGRGEK
ncbi:MAG: glycine/betaine/sarcosine/D-proline family reductase selenoprotein B [Acidobacteriota bacterium]|nr:glycine/betaine/sarcosine/D-proline family reductase selenoprotein B [Acidobacteriota bacterium]